MTDTPDFETLFRLTRQMPPEALILAGTCVLILYLGIWAIICFYLWRNAARVPTEHRRLAPEPSRTPFPWARTARQARLLARDKSSRDRLVAGEAERLSALIPSIPRIDGNRHDACELVSRP